MPVALPGQVIPAHWQAAAQKKRTVYPALMSSRLVRLAPIWFFQIYLTGSIVSFAFGPVEYDVANPITLYTYVALGQLSIAIGYSVGISKLPRRYVGYFSPRTLLQMTILLTLILLPITLQYRNYGNLGLAEALADPNAAYMARLKSFEDAAATPWLSTARGLLAPLLALFVPMGIVYWGGMNMIWRALWAAGVGGVVTLALFTGAAVGLFDLVLVIPWMLWLGIHHRSAQPDPRTVAHGARLPNRSLFRRVMLVAITGAVVFAGLSYFSHSRRSRYGLGANEYPMWTTDWSEEQYGIKLPAAVEYTIYSVTNYWSHGYEGLSECLQLPFEWSYGCGHSRFWARYLGKMYTDPDWFEEQTYPARLESTSGYDANTVWHTAYPWLASDLTFPGALLFVGMMGYLLAQVWADAVCKTNPFAVGFLAQLLIFLYYIPANNGRLSYPEETLAFWGTLLLWRLTRERRLKMRVALPMRTA